MEPIKIMPCTRVLGRPSGTLEEDCSSLEISDFHDAIWGNVMRSAWTPSREEREAIANGAPVILQIVGTVHPVVALFTGQWIGDPVKGSRLSRLEQELPKAALEWEDARHKPPGDQEP